MITWADMKMAVPGQVRQKYRAVIEHFVAEGESSVKFSSQTLISLVQGTESLKGKIYGDDEEWKLLQGIGNICSHLCFTKLRYMPSFIDGTLPVKELVTILWIRDATF